MRDRAPRITYISGPANVRRAYNEWMSNQAKDFFGTDYMKQFFDLAESLGAESHVVSWLAGEHFVERVGRFTFENRPMQNRHGLAYHLGMIVWFLKVLVSVVRFRPDVVVLTGNQNMWWMLAPARWLGAKFIVSYHCVLYAKFRPIRRTEKILIALNEWLVLRYAAAIVMTSHDIRVQVEALLGDRAASVPMLDHLPTYQPAQFAGIALPHRTMRWPFHILFVGRVEENKGVFDMIEVSRRLATARPGHYKWDLCGSGGKLDAVRSRVGDLGLADAVTVHGHCGPDKLRELLGSAHVCVVPTRSSFEAGFEMTCAEAILAGRPLVTSAVCPALHYLRPATIEVPPDDIDAYEEALIRLSEDDQLYRRLQGATGPLKDQFFDDRNSWYVAMLAAIRQHGIS
ncbi:glycosyltransferase family 4 protein [Novosphingobium piscinae]|uniref:Glycosyltransferase family 4 protein n=1 Tax=Novosphingobium piscinae TaxID=1507448 RepID=A0A7X1KNW0_9SPHN|nr:glycosyltransferase family 4 protein [Novosphingobium piscinae]MBC2668114.1 glycosyltransferase family 4 protein [Novosphingobium piscinae]